MKTLFLVHVEEMFRDFFPTMYIPRICKAMNQYEQIYVFCSGVMDYEPIPEIYKFQNYEQIDWGWGYEPASFEHQPEEQQFVIPAYGHEYTWIPEILRDNTIWEKHEIHLGGGADKECLQDMRDILNHQQIKFKNIRGLIY